ncbi:MAG: type II toxin-antitoxin system RelE/ParE family toxin [Chloroflexota bacterium]|nr:type II toxin-antitoxin system RelE/ParE family toxin [Chloroflexota bacterium]
MEIREYIDASGRNPYNRWISRLDTIAARRIDSALFQMRSGNLSNARNVGRGVSEYRINFGPGYRIYFGRDGNTLIILLGGGTKSRQPRDIQNAHVLWQEYRRRKRQES